LVTIVKEENARVRAVRVQGKKRVPSEIVVMEVKGYGI
jgi:hypothetical protein